MKKIETLVELADYINAGEEWTPAVEEIIEANGWISDTDTEYGICHNDEEILEFNERGEAVVRSGKGEAK